MKLLSRYLFVTSLAVLLAAAIISYHSYKAKTTDQSIGRYTKPLIDRKLNALVINKSVTSVTERTQSQNAMVYSLKVNYTDLESGRDSNFIMNIFHGKAIATGDTIKKKKGESFFVLYKKEGGSFTIQIE